ncbi:opsin-3 [Xenopus laevis]|uniref:Opsin-3 n=2 Tax=Xenopus laevis TaxID=8355 RepID=A0A1L8HXX0_XENLA|nr:opsin-3 [Xenopus laevis]OCU00947.1 hypothetical protein XELAEV_18006726mg [Xenopus laevis]
MAAINESHNESISWLHSEDVFTEDTYHFLALIVAMVGCLGLIINLLVLILYCKFKRLQTPTNLLFFNASLSNFMFSLLAIIFTFLSCMSGSWAFSVTMCVFCGFSKNLLGIVSVVTLTVVAYERYIRVLYGQCIDFSWAKRAVSFVWVYSLAWAGFPLIGWNRYTFESHKLDCSLEWMATGPNDTAFVLLFFLACITLPLGIMAYCYGYVLYQIQKLRSVQNIQNFQEIAILDYEIKMAKMCLLMMLAFLIGWLPYAILSLLVASGYSTFITPTLTIMPSLLAMSRAAYNPVIYIFTIKKFQRCLIQLVCYHFWRSLKRLNGRLAMKKVKPILGKGMSHNAGRKKFFSSSSDIFTRTTSDTGTREITESPKRRGTNVRLIQVHPLYP